MRGREREERKREGRSEEREKREGGGERREVDSHVDNEGMQNGSKNGLLAVDVLHLSQPNHLRDCHNLESKELPRGDVSSQYNTTKCSCACGCVGGVWGVCGVCGVEGVWSVWSGGCVYVILQAITQLLVQLENDMKEKQ